MFLLKAKTVPDPQAVQNTSIFVSSTSEMTASFSDMRGCSSHTESSKAVPVCCLDVPNPAVFLGIWLTLPSKPNPDVESLRKQLDEAKERLAVSEANQRREEQDVAALRAEVDKLAQRVQSGKQSRHP